MKPSQSSQHDTIESEEKSQISTSDYEEYISLPLTLTRISDSQRNFFENPPWNAASKSTIIKVCVQWLERVFSRFYLMIANMN